MGFKDYSHQGGINEKGLCFDLNALPKSRLNPHPELPSAPTYAPPYEKHPMWVPVLILRKAATVEEAITIASKYQRGNWYAKSGYLRYQINFADAKGDAVVMSVDENGELAFSRKNDGEAYLISTNFNKANPQNALKYPCRRYAIAEGMLERLSKEDGLTVDYFKKILDSVHVEGLITSTLYSNVFDLKNGMIYLYHWQQFDEVVVLKVEEELAKGGQVHRIKDLFQEKNSNRATQEYRGYILFWCLATIGAIGGSILLAIFLKRRILAT